MQKYKRVLLKLSGESLAAGKGFGIDPERLSNYTAEIKRAVEEGLQVAIVIGGGNIFRGLSGAKAGFDRVHGDQMGMLATVINSLALGSALETIGVPAVVYTAVRMEPIGTFYDKWAAIRNLEAGKVVICAAGTGNPYFTTDTGASLRAIELECDAMLKGSRVLGVYDDNPETNPNAKMFDTITFDEVFARNLRMVDLTATAMLKDNKMPLVVFNMDVPGNLTKLLNGDAVGTLVTVE